MSNEFVERLERANARLRMHRPQALADGRRILVAEDNEINRLIVGRQLAMLGWACTVAHDGFEALLTWRRDPSRYWLLLTDLQMPQIDGYALARRIRAESSAGARLPIVAYTSLPPDDESERCRRAGIDECLAKPAPIERLSAALQRWRPHEQPAGHSRTFERPRAVAAAG